MNEVSKTIWMCWFQGQNDKFLKNSNHGLREECIKQWTKLNPNYKVNLLTDETIPWYAPEYYDIINDSPARSYQAKSDLLRLLLLSKYGGIWADITLYPIFPLDDFIKKILNKTNFFTYRFFSRSLSNIKGDREVVSWFLCSGERRHYLIEKWKNRFVDKYKTSNNWPYYSLHETLTNLYDVDIKVRYIIDNMVQINEKIPHSKGRKPSFMYKWPPVKKLKNGDFQKEINFRIEDVII